MFEKVNGYKHCLNLMFYLFSFTLHILFRSHSLCLFTVQSLYTIDLSIARLNIYDRVLRSLEKGWRHILADLKGCRMSDQIWSGKESWIGCMFNAKRIKPFWTSSKATIPRKGILFLIISSFNCRYLNTCKVLSWEWA